MFYQFELSDGSTLHVYKDETGRLRFENHVPRPGTDRSKCVWGHSLKPGQALELAAAITGMGF